MGRQGRGEAARAAGVPERQRPAPATLRDVARHARVDPSTVSRLVNADPGLRISESTRTRVETAIRELGYRPNVQARGLRLAKTWTVGVVVPDLMNPFYPPIIEGAEQRASETGYMVVIVRELDRAVADGDELSFERLIQQQRVDGLLVASGQVDDDVIRRLAGQGQPVVVVNRRVPGVAGSVIVDDEAAASLATAHLTEIGHRRLGHVAGPAGIDNSIRRRAGFEAAAAAVGASFVTEHGDGWGPESGYRAGERLMAGADVSAIFATNINVAAGVAGAARERGLAVPGDLSIMALHDSPVATYLEPALSTVVLPLESMGRVAFDVLLDRLDGATPSEVMISGDPELIIRSSTRPPSPVRT